MSKLIAFALTAALATSALAQESHQAQVTQVNCVQVGQNTSMTGAVVGGTLGTAGGAIVGSLFGKKGKFLGAVAGGLGGAAIGANGSKIYNCSILADTGKEQVMVSKQSEELVEVGQSVTVIKLDNGQWGAI